MPSPRKFLRDSSESEIQTLVGQIVDARAGLDEKLKDFQILVESLRKAVRKDRGESFSSYMVFVNAHSRLAAALSSGIQRTSSMDRILDRALQEASEEKSRREEAQRKAEERKQLREEQARSWLPPADPDFEELYGEVLDAE
jgi:hypothetical protein